ncbi:MAG: hypothetical protein NC079_06890 [Clostridium sp.]|nr:hypothetical protein [Acetatifactor muris]MCM1526885.1 hypothetical protein [Bacteroides sp.]MCM1563322.1 hypothetical protein [Clostridium sp.]
MRKRRGNPLQKVTALLLTAALVLGGVTGVRPAAALAAEDPETTDEINGETGHADDGIEAHETDAEVTYSTDGGATWQEASLIDAIYACYEPQVTVSEIKLLRDLVLDSENWSSGGAVLVGAGKQLTLNGDGHTITRGEDLSALFSVNSEGSSAILKDITVDGGAVWDGDDPASRTNTGIVCRGNGWLFMVDRDASLTLESGTVLQNNALGTGWYGAGVAVLEGTLVMKEGAVVRDNTAQTGGGICVQADGIFEMEGGEISGNYATNSGGGVFVQGNFTMSGGSIAGNQAVVGGGGVVVFAADAAFHMSGGSITGNRLTSGSGLGGGGIFMNGGIFGVSGNAVVNANKDANDQNSNVFLRNATVITLDEALTDGAKLGVTPLGKDGTSDFTSGWTERMGETLNPWDFFDSDAAAYAVIRNAATGEIGMHAHSMALTDAKEASCTKEGAEAYYACSLCGRWYEDEAAGTEIVDKTSVVIPMKAHTFGEWTVDVEPTKTEEGSRHRLCSVCGYSEADTIPALGTGGDPGNVEKEVEQGAGTPAISLPMDTDALADAVLSAEDLQSVEDGTDIRILLVVQDIDDTVSESDRQAVGSALSAGYTVGEYLDVELVKIIDEDRTPIAETKSPIRIVITVPDGLRADNRTYAVVRVHNGEPDMLADLDSDPATVTIETNLFSTYAIVYRDAQDTPGTGDNTGEGDNTGNDDTPGTGDNTGEGDNTGNDDTPGTGDNTGDENTPGEGDDTGNGDTTGTDDNAGGDTDGDAGDMTDDSDTDSKLPGVKDNEPKTGDNTPLEIWATLAMIAGFGYLFLYFANRDGGMTEEIKRELVSRLIGWANKGGIFRKWLALAAITVLLAYYHSIGKKVCAVPWKKNC